MSFKKIYFRIILGVFLSLFLFWKSAFFQEETLPKPGLTPDSPFYFLEIIAEKIGNFFTFGNEAEAKRMLTLADERMAEIYQMLKEKKIKPAQKGINRYQGHLQEYEKILKKMENEKESIVEVVQKGIIITEKHLAILEKISGSFPSETKPLISQIAKICLKTQNEAIFIMSKNNLREGLNFQFRLMEQRLERIKTNLKNKNFIAAKASLKSYEQSLEKLNFLLEAARKTNTNITDYELMTLIKTTRFIKSLWLFYKSTKSPLQRDLLITIWKLMKNYYKIKNSVGRKIKKFKKGTLLPPELERKIKKEIQRIQSSP